MYKNKLKELIDPSGKMFREKYLKEHHIEIYEGVIKFIKLNDLDSLPFKQQVYHYLNDIKNIVKCKNPNCNNTVKFKNSTIGYYTYCCNKCIGSDPDIIKEKELKSLEKYGTKTPAQSNIIKSKMIETNIKKYGHNSPLQNEAINKKSKETLYKNYGVDNPLKSNIIREKMKQTNIKLYGVENVKSLKEIQEKIKNTNLKRYDYEHAMQNSDIKQKTLNTLKTTILKKFLNYYPEYKIINLDLDKKEYTMICEHGHVFKISYTLLSGRRTSGTTICTICNPIDKAISGKELQLLNFIKENYSGEIIENDRKILNGKELDIYLPELKLAFEFNGLYWHSDLHKANNYHFKKSEECLEKGVQLIHIWEDDWKYKQNIIKSIILNKLYKTDNRIYARKTYIKEIIDTKIIENFLNDNHINNAEISDINLGLFYNNELVSIMTFIKNENDYILNRFCNKLNYMIIGGPSKLFKYFINNYIPKTVKTYVDRTYFNGNLYYYLGFKLNYKKDYFIDSMNYALAKD
ncbi:hypothetical protein M0Q97_05395 [Candidatus Dojkabacteria bacterium]|jgi:hypothetical protein|nr:hypothetical protein [Candidatus Dojkabacteria bacterium]